MTKLYRSNLWRGLFVLACASLAACQAAFGDYKSGQVEAGGISGVGGIGGVGGSSNGGHAASGGATPGGATSASACDSIGAYRCADSALEVCDSQQWQSLGPCSSDLCDSTNGHCMTCVPGAHRCAAFNLQTCSSTGDSWSTTKACDTAEYCDSASNTCLTCLHGETFCSGASLYECNSTQDGWDVTDCISADRCDSLAGVCQDCPSTEYVYCNGASLMGCDANLHRVQLDACVSAELCNQTLVDLTSSPATSSVKCDQGVCTPGDYRCNPNDGTQLQSCPPSALEWDTVDNCTTAALCDAINKKCITATCTPSAPNCNGATLQVCNSDGTAYTFKQQCQDAAHCSTAVQGCVVCTPGQSQCSGATLQTCQSGTSPSWDKGTPCASAALCDATNGVCKTPVCQAGTFNCGGTNGATLQHCATDFSKWVDQETCFDALHCDKTDGNCKPVDCTTAGQYRCQGTVRQQCDATTHTWVNVNDCSTTGLVCDLTAASGCDTCVVGATRCNSVSGLWQSEICAVVNGTNQWKYQKACGPSAAYCATGDAGSACVAPICTSSSQYQCDSAGELQQCDTSINGWKTIDKCTGKTCDVGGQRCDVCTPKKYACSGSKSMHCSDDGQTNTATDCGSASRCYVASDGSGGCYDCDTSTDAQCYGTNQIQTCGTSRFWNTPTTCPNGNGCVNVTGSADYCATCAVGEIQCVTSGSTSSTETCNASQNGWNVSATPCQYGCVVDSSGNDYCATTCTPNDVECIGSTNSTTYHKCNPDGKGWGGASTPACADGSNLKACVSGALSSTAKVACDPVNTPYCVSGQCVPCTSSSTRTCTSGNGQHCDTTTNTWVTDTCTGSTPVCSGGVCVQCTSASTPTCTNGNGEHCNLTTNTWVPDTCTGSTPKCLGGNCVQCTNPYPAICLDSKTVQGCSSTGSYQTTTCTGSNVCYADPNGASCKPCTDLGSNPTAPDCPDATHRRYCNGGSFATVACTGDSSYCYNGQCVGCDPATALDKCTGSQKISKCQSVSGGTYGWVESSCPTNQPYCATASSSSAAKCVQCAPDSALTCTDAVTSYQCVGGVATTVVCSGACYQGNCVTCAPSTSACIDTTTLHQCSVDGSSWGKAQTQCADVHHLATCSGGAFSGSQACSSDTPNCVSGVCIKQACTPNSYKCDSTGLSQCNADGTAWGTPVSCGSNYCDATAGKCDPIVCTANSYKCDSSGLYQCNATGTAWGAPVSCGSNYCDATAGTCDPVVCTANSYKCDSSGLYQCNATGTAWGAPVSCGSNYCDATAGKCDPIVCTANSYKCDSSGLYQCNATGTAWGTPVSCGSNYCDATAGKCDPVVCTANSYKCDSSGLYQCNATGTAWGTPVSCGSNYCDATAGKCDPVVCTANSYKCDSSGLYQCNATGTAWGTPVSCGSNYCDATAGKCDPIVCTANSYKCDSSGLYQCNATGTAWGTPVSCGSNYCDATAGKCDPIVCTANSFKCDTTSTLVQCNGNGTAWGTSQTCSNALLGCVSTSNACGCTSVADCLSVAPRCDTTNGICVACQSAADCTDPTKPTCSLVTGACVPS